MHQRANGTSAQLVRFVLTSSSISVRELDDA
jgi:hypothetical protein